MVMVVAMVVMAAAAQASRASDGVVVNANDDES